MFVIFLVPLVFLLIRLWRNIALYVKLSFYGLHPQLFDISGMLGLQWLNDEQAHIEFLKKSNEIGEKTFSVFRGATPVVVTNDVDLIHSISTENFDCFHSRIPELYADDPVTSNEIHMFAAKGERWKRLRTLTSYGLSTSNLKLLFPTIESCVTQFLNHVRNLSPERRIEIGNSHRLFQNHTSYILARCAYGQKEPSYKNNNFLNYFSQAFGAFSSKVLTTSEQYAYLLPELKSFLKVFNSQNDKKLQFANYLQKLVYQFSAFYTRDRNPKDNRMTPDDDKYSLIGYFFEHRNDLKLVEESEGQIDMKKVKVEKQISYQEIVAQCKFLSVAGFDTTANTLTLLFNFLAHNPELQRELYRREIKGRPRDLDYDSITSLSFLQNCIFETLRLVPHASPLQQRICTAAIKIGDYHFPKDCQIIMNPWGPHHDRSIWGEDVNKFRPSRFDNLTEKQKRAFMPFGVGPRQCVGMRFALLELKTTVYRILHTYVVDTPAPFIDRHGDNITMASRDTGTIWPVNHIGLILIPRTK